MNADDDFDRILYADALLEVPRLREVKGLRRSNLLRFTKGRVYAHLNEGVRDEAKLRNLVLADVEEKYGSVILISIIAAVVGFFVTRILERLFPKNPELQGAKPAAPQVFVTTDEEPESPDGNA